jgi:hypothetical protein
MHYRRWKKYGDPNVLKQEQMHGVSVAERLMARIRYQGDCWEWTGSLNGKGYGQINIKGGNVPSLVHRTSYAEFVGPIPEGLDVLHKCDNPLCFKPSHLFLGTHADNMKDKMEKGRHRYGVSQGSAHGMSKLTDAQVLEIRASAGPSRIVAEKYGISGRQVRDIRNRQSWKHLN